MACGCGCGNPAKDGKTFLHGHNRRDRTITPEMRAQRISDYNAKYQRENAEKCAALRKAWDTTNRDQKIATTKAWFVRNPTYKAQWRALHPESDREYAATHPRDRREYDARTKEQKAARTRRWAQEHPERRQVNQAKRRAQIAESGGDGVSHEQWAAIKEEYGHICAYCARVLPLTMDHVEPISKRGLHDVSNVVPACKTCNVKKHNRQLIVWLARSSRIGGFDNRSPR